MNTYESQKLEEELLKTGHRPVSDLKSADLLIINSCSVRQAAEDSVYGLGKALNKLTKKPTVILTGCLTGAAKTSRRRYEVSYLQNKAPFIDYFLTSEELLNSLPELLILSQSSTTNSEPAVKTGITGSVPISYGCNNFCSYCIVPYARGAERSRSSSEIKNEIDDLLSKGITEIMLLGQNVNSWVGKDPVKTFPDLVKEIHSLPGLTKLSFMTSNPWDFSDELVEVLKLPKIDSYLHLPVQSGSDSVLARMNRHYTAEDYLALVAKIKQAVPEIVLGTDIIVGFPGETDEEFDQTVDLIKKVGFKKIYMSMYSPRKGTVSAETMSDDVPLATKRQRHTVVLKLSKELGGNK